MMWLPHAKNHVVTTFLGRTSQRTTWLPHSKITSIISLTLKGTRELEEKKCWGNGYVKVENAHMKRRLEGRGTMPLNPKPKQIEPVGSSRPPFSGSHEVDNYQMAKHSPPTSTHTTFGASSYRHRFGILKTSFPANKKNTTLVRYDGIYII